MEEEGNHCAICPRTITRGTSRVPFYFCSECYHTYEADIKENAPWVRYLLNLEKQRRKRRNKRLTSLLTGG